jgi:hypothetical protein
MKKQLLTFYLLLITCSIYAQKSDSTIFNGASKLIIKNNLTAAENYKACGNALIALDYSIGGKDTEFYQLSSEPFKVAAQGASQVLAIYTVSKDNQITIIGRSKNLTSTKIVSFQDTENAYEVIPYKRIRPLAKVIYAKLEEFAKKLNGTITYSE